MTMMKLLHCACFIGIAERQTFSSVPHEETVEHASTDSNSGTLGCRAQNNMCSSLNPDPGKSNMARMPCDICCSTPGFCRDCSCILCWKTVDSANEGFSFIKCESLVGEGSICGHVAHMECALRAYMAGTVGGSIGLDAEYYCRRCDSRSELLPHVQRMMGTCRSVNSRDELEKILNLGVCILRGSQKDTAKSLLGHIESALTKVTKFAMVVLHISSPPV